VPRASLLLTAPARLLAPHRLVTTTRREYLRVLGVARGPRAAGYVMDAEAVPDEQAGTAEEELLAAERRAALLEAFRDLPPRGQRLILLLIEDPPVPYAEISARLGIPIGSIGPTRAAVRSCTAPGRAPDTHTMSPPGVVMT
jgi:DNA-directed RNA polymerase specialized sigma24 family protein